MKKIKVRIVHASKTGKYHVQRKTIFGYWVPVDWFGSLRSADDFARTLKKPKVYVVRTYVFSKDSEVVVNAEDAA